MGNYRRSCFHRLSNKRYSGALTVNFLLYKSRLARKRSSFWEVEMQTQHLPASLPWPNKIQSISKKKTHTHTRHEMFEYSKEIGLDSAATQQSRFSGELRVFTSVWNYFSVYFSVVHPVLGCHCMWWRKWHWKSYCWAVCQWRGTCGHIRYKPELWAFPIEVREQNYFLQDWLCQQGWVWGKCQRSCWKTWQSQSFSVLSNGMPWTSEQTHNFRSIGSQ